MNLIATLFLPESPSWLVGLRHEGKDPNKAMKKAERNLKWLYKKTEVSLKLLIFITSGINDSIRNVLIYKLHDQYRH